MAGPTWPLTLWEENELHVSENKYAGNIWTCRRRRKISSAHLLRLQTPGKDRVNINKGIYLFLYLLFMLFVFIFPYLSFTEIRYQ